MRTVAEVSWSEINVKELRIIRLRHVSILFHTQEIIELTPQVPADLRSQLG